MPRQPNFLLILSDEQRADTLPCYGNRFVEAPYLDRMAAEGTRFENCRTVFPACTPARASMWTGLYPHAHGIVRNVYGDADALGASRLADASVFRFLGDVGYECAYFGKWHLGDNNPGTFSVWETFNSLGGHWVEGRQSFQGGIYIPDRDTDRLISWMRGRQARDRPFAAVVSYYPPHDPFSSPLDCMDRYRRLGVPFPGYYGSVTALDRCVGRVLAALEESDLLDDTIVFYLSDHGETFHDRDGVTGKFVCTDDALRVPFIVMYRGRIPPGRRSSALIGLLDIMPTMLDYAGAIRQNDVHGQSLRFILEGADDTRWRQSFYVENETHHALPRLDEPVRPRCHERAVCTDRFKLIVAADDDAPRLHCIEKDPEERLDIVGGNLVSAGIQTRLQVEWLLRALLEHATAVDDDFGIEIARRHLVAMSG
jgi:arylsulfatase A-like enzyme